MIGSLDHALSKSRSFANDGWIERVRPRSDVSGLTFDQFLISRAAKNWQRSVFTCLRGQIDHDSVGALCIDSNVTRNKRVYRVYVRCDWATSKQLLWFIACIIRTVYQKPDSGLSYSRCPSASPPPPPFRSMEFPRSEDLLEDRVSHELDTLLVTMRLERSCADTINCNGGFDERIKLRKGDGI